MKANCDETSSSSHVNYRYAKVQKLLISYDLIGISHFNQVNSVQKECHAVKARLNQLVDTIAAASEVAGISLDEGVHEDNKLIF